MKENTILLGVLNEGGETYGARTSGHAHLILTGAEKDKDSYDYFRYSDELLDRCIEYLNRPGLVDGIHHLIANP